MNEYTVEALHKPSRDDKPLWDLVFAHWGYVAILVAHDLKLFSLLAEGPRTLVQICDELKLADRAAEALLSLCVSAEMLQLHDDRYGLTPYAEEYLLESSPTYLGGVLDLHISTPLSFESLKQSILTNTPQWYKGDWIKTSLEQAETTREFTRALHSYSMGSAMVWPTVVDLSDAQLLLDIGGGSGAHSICATLRWPNLKAIIFDRAPVAEIAQEFIASYGLQQRIQTQVGDMWQDPFPAADLHLYSQVYHDWLPEKCQFLTCKSFESLKSGGRLLIHEILYNDAKTGPFAAAAQNIGMFWATEGQQLSGRELSIMMTEAGFVDIEIKPTLFGYRSIVSGRKP